MRTCVLGILLVTFCSILAAQQTSAPQTPAPQTPTQQTMDMSAVVQLEKAGVSDTVIIGMINASPCNFDTSTNGIIAFKNAGVDDAVVIAIINRMNSLAHPRPPYIASSPVALDDPDDPMSPHEAGVYLMTGSPGVKQTMIFIDRVGESSMKVSNLAGAAFSFGTAKMKLKAEIPGPHAQTRTTDARPVFYMYFPDISSFAAFGGPGIVTSPNQFSLLKVEEQKNDRETVVASTGITGASIGADEKKSVPFTTDRVHPRMYKITPSADLKPGEYAFIAVIQGVTPETPPTTVVYDFGADAKPQ